MKNVGRQQGWMLLEALVYVSLLGFVLALSCDAYYRVVRYTRDLRRNADDIARTLAAGERWRADVRAAVSAPALVQRDGHDELLIPHRNGRVAYVFTDGTVWRRSGENGSAVPFLKRVKASGMMSDPRQYVTVWRWEIELATPQKSVRRRPLFTFEAVAKAEP